MISVLTLYVVASGLIVSATNLASLVAVRVVIPQVTHQLPTKISDLSISLPETSLSSKHSPCLVQKVRNARSQYPSSFDADFEFFLLIAYVNSFLATLNARQSIGGIPTDSTAKDTNSVLPSFRAASGTQISQISTTGGQTTIPIVRSEF